MVLSRIDVLNPRPRERWNAPPEKFENTPSNTVAYCVGMMYARLYGYCSWLSKCSRCHPLLHLTLFKALVTHGYVTGILVLKILVPRTEIFSGKMVPQDLFFR